MLLLGWGGGAKPWCSTAHSTWACVTDWPSVYVPTDRGLALVRYERCIRMSPVVGPVDTSPFLKHPVPACLAPCLTLNHLIISIRHALPVLLAPCGSAIGSAYLSHCVGRPKIAAALMYLDAHVSPPAAGRGSGSVGVRSSGVPWLASVARPACSRALCILWRVSRMARLTPAHTGFSLYCGMGSTGAMRLELDRLMLCTLVVGVVVDALWNTVLRYLLVWEQVSVRLRMLLLPLSEPDVWSSS